MGLPSKKRTNRSKRDRASHFALKPTTLAKCPECSAVVLPHVACKKCGTYRGRKVSNPAKRVERRTRRLKKIK
ncbi:MAG: 50S ribosomal protein L32 [bacterium]|nr:50S ribosomal protein L32 [bacterium]